MEPKHPELVRRFFRYQRFLTPLLLPAFQLVDTSDKFTATGTSSRKRRRNGGHHGYDADQEYEISGTFHPDRLPSFRSYFLPISDRPTNDVSRDVIDRAQSITETDALQVKTAGDFSRLEANLKREIYVCGHRLQHFLSLRTHLVEELNTLRSDWSKNHDASPLEPDDIPEADVRSSYLQSLLGNSLIHSLFLPRNLSKSPF
jgi:hypothetical protein